MTRKVTFTKDCELRTTADDAGPTPRQVRVFRAGETATLPRHQLEQALRLGAVEPADAPSAPDDKAGR